MIHNLQVNVEGAGRCAAHAINTYCRDHIPLNKQLILSILKILIT